MKARLYQLLLGMFFFPNMLHAQNINHQTLPVYDENGHVLSQPFTGGNISSIFSEVDLNNDGLMDLFVFDSYGNVSMTYINMANTFHYDPAYAANFPDFKDWVLLRDYDNDGIMDAFSHDKDEFGSDILKVHKGFYSDNMLHFEAVPFYNSYGEATYMDMGGSENLIQIQDNILPAIDDLDGDGDLDLISSKATGGYLHIFKNVSVENGWNRDSLHFIRDTPCYGGALEEGDDVLMVLSSIPGECPSMFAQQQFLHNGYSFLSLDQDGDGDKDLLRGDGNFTQMNMLTNGGTPELAHFVAQDTAFPNYDVTIDAILLPIASYVDADFDGKKDLLVSSKFSNPSVDGYSSFYKNTGTTNNPVFEFQEEDWQVKNTICYGKFANPTFTDYNRDGLMDMVIATQTTRLNPEQIAASLILFENTGTLTYPAFTLIDTDWLGLSELNSYWLNPTFGDLDQDGDEDLLVGDIDGKLTYLHNNAGGNMPYSFDNPVFDYMGIDVSSYMSPQIMDMDADGLEDIVVGVRQGYMVFFKNVGTNGNPSFNADPNDENNIFPLGEISLGVAETIIPFFMEIDDELVLFAGTQGGKIMHYNNIMDNLDGAFDLVDDNWGNIRNGEYISPSFIDINRDGYLDIFMGNYRGGINLFDSSIYVGDEIVAINDIQNNSDILIHPNPVSNHLFIENNTSANINNASIHIYNVLGMSIFQQQISIEENHTFEIDVNSFPKGVYWLSISLGNDAWVVQSFVKE